MDERRTEVSVSSLLRDQNFIVSSYMVGYVPDEDV